MEIIKKSPASSGEVVAYVRCAAQDTGGAELQRRTAETLAVAAAHGLTVKPENVIAEYGSGDISARPGLQGLLRRVGSGSVGAVVVLSLDRLSRSFPEAEMMKRAFDEGGVLVYTRNGLSYFTTPPDTP